MKLEIHDSKLESIETTQSSLSVNNGVHLILLTWPTFSKCLCKDFNETSAKLTFNTAEINRNVPHHSPLFYICIIKYSDCIYSSMSFISNCFILLSGCALDPRNTRWENHVKIRSDQNTTHHQKSKQNDSTAPYICFPPIILLSLRKACN